MAYNEELLSKDLQHILEVMFSTLKKKLSISYHEEYGERSKVLSVNHNNLSICRLKIDSIFIEDSAGTEVLEKCGELLSGMLIHTLLIRYQTGAKQLQENDDKERVRT